MKIAIIGGGACGLICASYLAQNSNHQIDIIEINHRVGKKILLTGNGRCNLSNKNIEEEDYNHPFAMAIKDVNVINYFKSLGLYLYQDDEGRYYPLTNQASSVLDVLRNTYLTNKKVNEKTEHKIEEIIRQNNKYMLTFSDGSIALYEIVIICIGSPIANNNFSSHFMNHFAFQTTPFKPSLCPLICKTKGLNGIRLKGNIEVYNKQKLIYSENDCEIQFKDNGISGIGVFNASFYLNKEKKLTDSRVIIKPLNNYENFSEDFITRIKRNQNMEASQLFCGIFHRLVALIILEKCQIKPTTLVHELSDTAVENLIAKAQNIDFDIQGLYSLSQAQVSHGGINIAEISNNFEATRFPNLFLGGEILDIDGKCGGYNLHFAFASGLKIAKSIIEKK